MPSPWCDATCGWRRRFFTVRGQPLIRRNSWSPYTIDLQILSPTPLEMRKAQLGLGAERQTPVGAEPDGGQALDVDGGPAFFAVLQVWAAWLGYFQCAVLVWALGLRPSDVFGVFEEPGEGFVDAACGAFEQSAGVLVECRVVAVQVREVRVLQAQAEGVSM